MKSVFTKDTRKRIRELLCYGIHAFCVPWYMEILIDNVEYNEYDDLPPAAKVELCRMEASVYLKGFPDATKEERHLVKKYALLGRSVYEYAPELNNKSDILSATRLWHDLKMSGKENPISFPDDDDDLPF